MDVATMTNKVVTKAIGQFGQVVMAVEHSLTADFREGTGERALPIVSSKSISRRWGRST